MSFKLKNEKKFGEKKYIIEFMLFSMWFFFIFFYSMKILTIMLTQLVVSVGGAYFSLRISPHLDHA